MGQSQEKIHVQVWDTSSVRPSELQGAVGPSPTKLQTKAAVVAHDKDINAVAVSPDDALACTASQDRTVKVSPVSSRCSLPTSQKALTSPAQQLQAAGWHKATGDNRRGNALWEIIADGKGADGVC